MAGMGLPPQGMMPPEGMPPMGGPALADVFPMATPDGAQELLAMFEQQKAAEHEHLGQMHDEMGMMLMDALGQQQGGGAPPMQGFAEGAGMDTVGASGGMPPELAAMLGGGQPEASQGTSGLPPELLAALAGGQLG